MTALRYIFGTSFAIAAALTIGAPSLAFAQAPAAAPAQGGAQGSGRGGRGAQTATGTSRRHDGR